MADEQKPDYDSTIAELCRTLISAFVKDANAKDATHGKTPLAKLQNAIRYDGNEAMWDGITALSAYTSARAAERQAIALEIIARNSSAEQLNVVAAADAQALIDQRTSKRDYLASTYSLDSATLSLLWAIRGMLMDAAVKALSRPASFEPYERVTSAELAWSLRVTVDDLYRTLPRNDDGQIDYRLLEDFGIFCYGGSTEHPDDWMFGG